jgi:hypothetical protein
MLNMYAAWTEGAKESDVEAIKQAMESSPHKPQISFGNLWWKGRDSNPPKA